VEEVEESEASAAAACFEARAAAATETSEVCTQASLPGPRSPMYPGKQGPHVFSLVVQRDRNKVPVQLMGASEQSTKLMVELAVAMACLVTSMLPLPAANCEIKSD